MSDIFISYARSTATQAAAVADALRSLGYGVWSDDDLPAHRAYAEVIEERLAAAKAVVVIWSAEAARSEWVQSEADRARAERKLVQLTIDGAPLPMPFDRIQCADLAGWTGDVEAPGWRKVTASIAELIRGALAPAAPVAVAPPPLPAKPSIAVMPFANLSGDPEQEYFADGMVEEIVTALSRVRSLFVIGSGSSLTLKGVDPQEAARRLGVRYVLEGSVRKAAGRVRIAVKLVDASDGAQIWSRRFEDTLEDVFALQDEVALAVAGKIEPAVQQAEIGRASGRPTESMTSYDFYLRALTRLRTYAKAPMLEAVELAGRAIALDPEFSSALSLAALCHYMIAIYGWSDEPDEHRRAAIDLARRALKVAGDDATALSYAATIIAGVEGDHQGAVALVERAIAINPGSAEAWLVRGILQVRLGDPELAIQHLEQAMRLDPMGPSRPAQITWIGVARFRQQRFADVIALEKEAVQLTDVPIGYLYLAASYGHMGQPAAAREALARYRSLSPLPIDAYARSTIIDPAHLKLFLEGIGVAEGDEAER